MNTANQNAASERAGQLPDTMIGVVLTGHGGFDKLEYREDIALPKPGRGEVLTRVAAAGINNTDVNTRTGWYSKAVKSASEVGGASGLEIEDDDASGSGVPLAFPRIQGGDCCGRIVAVGDDVDSSRIGERLIERNLMRWYSDYRPWEYWTYGSDIDGAFAQYTKAPSRESYQVDCDWTDVELASIS